MFVINPYFYLLVAYLIGTGVFYYRKTKQSTKPNRWLLPLIIASDIFVLVLLIAIIIA